MSVRVHFQQARQAFLVEPGVNVRHTFGPASFLVDDTTHAVVSLDLHGAPLVPLDPAREYTVFVGSSPQLRRQVQTLQGQLHAAHNELTRLRERHSKLTGCIVAELAHIHSLLDGSDLPSAAAAAAAAATAAAAAGSDPSAAPSESAAEPPRLTLPSSPGHSPPVGRPAHLSPAPDGSWHMTPIGHIRTCYVEKNGTPRQGCVCPSSAAVLKLQLGAGLNAAHALEMLDHFSHVWLVFVFDRNGNAATKSKVHPPRLDGGRVGLFSTRTPHRPNPIGLSLVKLDAVRADVLHLSGIDLVDGTPILDVKPFVPFADGAHLPHETLSVAPWLSAMPTPDLAVRFSTDADSQLQALAPSLRLLGSVAQARKALTEVLTADPRSVHWRQNRGHLQYGLSLDCLNAVVEFAHGEAVVTQVQHIDQCDRSHCDGAAGTRAPPDEPQGERG
jgi:tRNA-Thr(GGU) m(6)t(6)A37 methyltransferase TsaA